LKPQLSSPYHAYILRCWREKPQAHHRQPVLRFSLQDVGTRQRRSFANWGELTAFLENNLLDVTPDVTDEQI
jgi:hypothetical protein